MICLSKCTQALDFSDATAEVGVFLPVPQNQLEMVDDLLAVIFFWLLWNKCRWNFPSLSWMLFIPLFAIQSNFDRQWLMDSDKHCGVISLVFKGNAPLKGSTIPQNNFVLLFKIGLEMMSQQWFEVRRLIANAIHGHISLPAMFGGHYLFPYFNSNCLELWKRKYDEEVGCRLVKERTL